MKEKKKKLLATTNFPIIGIGASAGGLAAFEAFFSGMPIDVPSAMAFVLVQHLDPDHKSILTSLIQRYTKMEVFEVEDSMIIKQNCAYIIPPGHNMVLSKGKLQLSDPTSPRGQRLPIDFFFESLAKDQKERAICIILSGNGKDGTKGLQAIKAEGGMVIAQNPESADFESMPRSAINTGLVDFELNPSKMYVKITEYISNENKNYMQNNNDLTLEDENLMQSIYSILLSQTAHDFSQYKLGTIFRRIERRMLLNQIQNLANYVEYLQKKPSEVNALFQDLLISVTNFFRDEEVFQFLKNQIIPNLFENKKAGSIIRVWVPGCATGEEAYSITILLQQYIETLKLNFKIQVFATDLDNRAIMFARRGEYPYSIKSNISSEILEQFFTIETNGNYCIQKRIRDLVVFSEQDLIKDPPFSKIDLISCRNLLIYLGSDLQKRLIPLFHYALNPAGILMLGTSETIGEFTNLFTVLDRKWKFYQRLEYLLSYQHARVNHFSSLVNPSLINPITQTINKPVTERKIPLREITEKALLAKVTPPSVVVNLQGDILYIHGRTGMFLEPSLGEAGVNNIFKMAREGLKTEISILLKEIVNTRETIRRPNLRVKTNGHYTNVNLTINTIKSNLYNEIENLYLISFEEIFEVESESSIPVDLVEKETPESGGDQKYKKELSLLRKELHAKEDFIQSTIEELEMTNEELKSSNEEMQSVNEELQSSNEELETAKEELQSINEELSTVNTELNSKLSELSRVNNDMNNLLTGTGIATIFLDQKLHILRFTPTATRIVNLIEGDIGRPLEHILSNLVHYDSLLTDVRFVMDTLIPKEVEVQIKDNNWYTLRIIPYRTQNNVIEGVVINFIDITERKKLENSLKIEKQKLEFHSTLLGLVGDAVIASDLNGIIVYWNKAAEEIYGWKSEEVLGKNIINITHVEENIKQAQEIMQALESNKAWSGESKVRHRNGHTFTAWVTDTALYDETRKVSIIIGISRDITVHKENEEKIQSLLNEKEIILREVHHRIKNNMSTIGGLLTNQASSLEDKFTIELLEDARNRVHSMMLLYDKLYLSPNFLEISVKIYLPSLLDEIIKNFSNRDSVLLEQNIEDFVLDAKRLQPLGIIINELLTNIMKYAFKDIPTGKITVSAYLKNNIASFIVEDNGVGFSDLDNSEKQSGFGLMLVNLLTKQLKGNLQIERTNGARITLQFKI